MKNNRNFVTQWEAVFEEEENVPPSHRQRNRFNPTSPGRQRPPWLTISDSTGVGKAMESLQRAGMRVGYAFDKQIRNVLTFRNTGARKCLFGETHTSNNFGCVFTKEGNITYKCHGTACEGKTRVIGRWKELDLGDACDFSALTPAQLKSFDPAVPARAEEILIQQNADKKTNSGKLMWHEMDGYDQLVRFQIQYLSHFFKHVTGTATPEILQVWYDDDGRLTNFTRRSFQNTVQIVRPAGQLAFNNWSASPDKPTYLSYCSEMDRSKVPDNKFNLLLGSRPFEV